MAYKPVPFALDQAPPDLTIQQTMFYLSLSARAVQRLCGTGVLDSYLLGGSRRIIFASVKRYREACIAEGPQFAHRPMTGKRKPGRPRSKPRPEGHAIESTLGRNQ
jgi:hypothetical protein